MRGYSCGQADGPDPQEANRAFALHVGILKMWERLLLLPGRVRGSCRRSPPSYFIAEILACSVPDGPAHIRNRLHAALEEFDHRLEEGETHCEGQETQVSPSPRLSRSP